MYVNVWPGGSVSSGTNVSRAPSIWYVVGPYAVTIRISDGIVAVTCTRSPGSDPVLLTCTRYAVRPPTSTGPSRPSTVILNAGSPRTCTSALASTRTSAAVASAPIRAVAVAVFAACGVGRAVVVVRCNTFCPFGGSSPTSHTTSRPCKRPPSVAATNANSGGNGSLTVVCDSGVSPTLRTSTSHTVGWPT